MPADAERVQVVLGAVVRAEQRLAWAKIMSRLGASTNIQALLSEEHGRGLPRLVGELLLAASVSTAELVIARTEMQVRQRFPPSFRFFLCFRVDLPCVYPDTQLGQNSGTDTFSRCPQAIQTGARVDTGGRSVYTGFSANRTGGLGNQEPLSPETVRHSAPVTTCSQSRE